MSDSQTTTDRLEMEGGEFTDVVMTQDYDGSSGGGYAQPRTKVLGIAGSLRRESFNRRLVELAQSLTPPTAELVVWDGLKAIPPFDEDDEADPPSAVVAMRSMIADADGLLVATPEYNSSLPGQLKNALDWASRPRGASVLEHKPVAVIGASPLPSGAARAQATARQVLTAAHATVLDDEFAVAQAHQAFQASGGFLDPTRTEHLARVLGALVKASRSAERAKAA